MYNHFNIADLSPIIIENKQDTHLHSYMDFILTRIYTIAYPEFHSDLHFPLFYPRVRYWIIPCVVLYSIRFRCRHFHLTFSLLFVFFFFCHFSFIALYFVRISRRLKWQNQNKMLVFPRTRTDSIIFVFIGRWVLCPMAGFRYYGLLLESNCKEQMNCS